MTKDSGRLGALVRGFRGRRVLVVADLVADEFVYGKVERISREAPVLILRHDTTDLRLGGGANAVHNICSLGGRPVPFGVLGRDEPGQAIRAQLRERGIPTSRVVNEAGYSPRSRPGFSPGAPTRRSSRSCGSTRPRRSAGRARPDALSSRRCAPSPGGSTGFW